MDIAFWRDVAVVVLAVEGLLFGLIPLALFLFAIRGIRWLDRQTRDYATLARDEWLKIHQRVERTATIVRAPFERTERTIDAVRTFLTRGGAG